MKVARSIALGVLLLGFAVAAAEAQTFIWSGLGTGWQGQVTPPNDGSAILYFTDVLNKNVTLPGNFNVDVVLLYTDDTFNISPAAGAGLPLTLSTTAVVISSTNYGRLVFDPNINLTSVGGLGFDSGNGTIVVPGQITGNPALVILASSGGSGAVIFNNSGAGNTYTGNTDILTTASGGSGYSTVAFWNSSPFGTGTVSFLGQSYLIAHNTLTVANPLNFDIPTAGNIVLFKSWDAPLTFSGPVTLSTSTTLNAQVNPHFIPSADNSGVFLSPGSGARNPIVFSGAITQTGGPESLTLNGPGLFILEGSGNTYSGGTVVNGSLVLTPSAIPTSGGKITVNSNGYVGVAATSAGLFNIADFASLLASFNLASTGTVGIDTLPGNSTTVLTSPINLTSFTNSAISLGTATSAILQAIIIPQGPNYQFGNGGGWLYVQSDLADVASPSQLNLTSLLPSPPLKLYLEGANTYSGGTNVNNGLLFFDAASALPASGQLVAGGSATTAGLSYIGYTDAVSSLTPASFLSHFNVASTWGIIGFDSHAPASPVTISAPIDLTGFNDGVFLGTASVATLSGMLTPSSVANGSNAADTLRFTAALGGTLTVTSTLADLNGGITPLSVMLGGASPMTVPQETFSDGTVVINPATANTYSGGTTLNTNGPLTLSLGGITPLGTGALTIVPNGFAPVGLSATANLNLANNVVIQPPNTNQNPATLYLTGNNNFTLSGNISGYGDLVVSGTPGLTVTLSGNNSGYAGDLDVFNAQLNLATDTAAGTGTLYFDTPSAITVLTSAAPTLYGIHGDYGSLVVQNGATLTVDTTNSSGDNEFGGVISGPGGGPTTAALVVTSGVPTGSGTRGGLYLSGANNYTGGTTVTNYGILGVGNNQALGSGMVTVNAPFGGVALNTGITFTNPLTFTAGGLAGFGTFAPSNLSTITFGAGQQVIPGVPNVTNNPVGTLTFATNVVFANGGSYEWGLQDVTRTDGFSQLVVNGSLGITATGGGFLLNLETFDPITGSSGFATFTPGNAYSWVIATAATPITGFSPGAFSFDITNFEGGLYTSNNFFVSLDGTGDELLLNFTPIPEPSTWALLASGVGVLGLAALRRRR